MADEARLWDAFVNRGDWGARERLVRHHLPFARGLAMRYRMGNEPVDDLIQVASLGLVNAVDRFDPARGIPFKGFATPTILGELKRHFRDRAWTIRVPRGLHDLIPLVERAISRLQVELQRSPSVTEIAAHLEMEPSLVLEALGADRNRSPLSLDRPLGEGEDESPAGEWVGNLDEGYEKVEDRIVLDRVLPELSGEERELLRLRFIEDLTQGEIAERLGCSQMQVSRLLRRALDGIRARVEEERTAKGTGVPSRGAG